MLHCFIYIILCIISPKMYMLRQKHKSTVVIMVLIIVLTFLSVWLLLSSRLQATTTGEAPACGDDISLAYFANPYEGQIIEDTVPIDFHSGQPSGLKSIELKTYKDESHFRNIPISITSPNNAYHEWNTRDSNQAFIGSQYLVALVGFNDGFTCLSQPRHVTVNNPVLKVVVEPHDTWEGYVNDTTIFEARAFLYHSDGELIAEVTGDADFLWSTNVGQINPESSYIDYLGHFTASSVPSVGKISVKTTFQDYPSKIVSVDIVVLAEGDSASSDDPVSTTVTGDNTTSDGSTTTSDSTENAEDTTRSDTGDIVIPEDPRQVDSRLAQCLLNSLGEKDYEILLERDTRMTLTQIIETYSCFEERRFIIPSDIAPIPPEKVRELREEAKVARIESREQAFEEDGKRVKGIEFSGYSTPDSPILIYVFSDPIILSSETDSDGHWTYTLEDPLEPGNHEAYVLAETDEGYVRSPTFGFEVAQAASENDNPYGYSLALASNDTSQFKNYFIAGVALLVLSASVILSKFVWFNKPRKAIQPADTSQPIRSVEISRDSVQDVDEKAVEASKLIIDEEVPTSPTPNEVVKPESETTVSGDNEIAESDDEVSR